MDKFRFLKWEVYSDAKEVLSDVLQIVKTLPREYRFELGSQIIRSAFSIILNIAEGSGKASDREMNRFIEIALGSVNETLAGVDVLKDNRLVEVHQFNNVYQKLYSISNQLGGFKKKLVVGHKS